jgi:cation diffusion facilitator CzcD-associated flavoprotein CzcO
VLADTDYRIGPLRVIAVGGGVSGINLAKFLGAETNNITLRCYEKNSEIGGTWYENRYPGVACDVPSHNYQVCYARDVTVT